MPVTSLRYNDLEYLLSELRRISALVSLRVQQMRAEAQTEEDEFRGLYVSEEEIDLILSDPNLFLVDTYESELKPLSIRSGAPDSRLAHLQSIFNLSSFELDVILITLAPELDLRYERLYAYLQDDVTKKRPTVDLILRLLCPGLAKQVAARGYFDQDSKLIRYRLVELTEDNNRQGSLLSRSIKLDDGVVAYLLGEDNLDPRLRTLADLKVPEHTGVIFVQTEVRVARLIELAEEAPGDGFVCVVAGPDDIQKRDMALELCRKLEIPMINVDVMPLFNNTRAESILRLLNREAALRKAAIYWTGFENLFKDDPGSPEAKRLVISSLRDQSCINIMSSSMLLPPIFIGQGRREFQFAIEQPTYAERQRLWETQLGEFGAGLDLESLSSRFRLNSGHIVAAVATAKNEAKWRGEAAPTLADLEASCRRHSSQVVSGLARRMKCRYGWKDIVLAHEQLKMLKEICDQVRNRALVYEKWGFDRKLSNGKGLNVVFAGVPGTGKTMSAEIMGTELGLDLYKIELSHMVSKYIGETEKNLERVFTEAGESNAILFFDEADSIFGKRSEVKDAHDRYANMETAYLLQKMEEYEGIVVLATNLRKNMDDAFVRRMHFVIEYPFPEEPDRYEIWNRLFPKSTPMGPSVDLHFMARQFKIAGGNIKNIGLTSAFLAAGDNDNSQIEMIHLIKATRREYQKMGKLCTQAEFGPYFHLLNEMSKKVPTGNLN
jgi:hypothetical protein